jgi:hypothetical protein
MKLLFSLTLSVVVVVCVVGCRTASHTGTGPYVYEYRAQVLAIPSCEATVVELAPCYALVKCKNGRSFYVGGPGAAKEVACFVGTLEEGNAYLLPDAFMEYLEDTKTQSNK